MASCHVRLTSLRSVEVFTTSCASYGRLSGHCLKMRVKRWSRRSSPVTWTLCNSASRKAWWTGCSRYRTPPPVWYTGTRRSDRTPLLRQLHWLPVRQCVDFTVNCEACSPVAVWHFTIVPSQRPPSFCRCSQRWLYVPQRDEHALWVVMWTPSTIEDLQLLDLDYGTVFHRTRKRQSYNRFQWSLKIFLIGWWGRGAMWTILIAPFRNHLTHLLT